MSSGAFESGRYQDANLAVRAIRVQPETKALVIATVANAYPAGAVTTSPRAKVTGSNRKIGVNARKVTIRFTGTPPTGYKPLSSFSLPWFVASTFAAIVEGAVGTYLSAPIEVVGTKAEKIK